MRFLAIVFILTLAACATAEQHADALAAYITENYSQTCVKLGYEARSEGHRNCMLSMYNTDEVRKAAMPPQWGPYWGRVRR